MESTITPRLLLLACVPHCACGPSVDSATGSTTPIASGTQGSSAGAGSDESAGVTSFTTDLDTTETSDTTGARATESSSESGPERTVECQGEAFPEASVFDSGKFGLTLEGSEVSVLTGVRCVAGAGIIVSATRSLEPMASLERVGSLTIADSTLPKAGLHWLESLERVTTLSIVDVSGLGEASGSVLSSVSQAIHIRGLQDLQTIKASTFMELDSLTIADNPNLVALETGAGRARRISIENSPDLAHGVALRWGETLKPRTLVVCGLQDSPPEVASCSDVPPP